MRQSCVYLTTYSGNKLPPFYIGSAYIEKIEKHNYRGSVRSREYQTIWKSELLENPHFFRTQIISVHNDRNEATEKEYLLQRHLQVLNNPMYINMAYANKNGCFGAIRTSQWKGKRGAECPWTGVKKSRRENYVASRLGAKNPSAKSYRVFNSEDKQILECTANIARHCIEHGIPPYVAKKLKESADVPLHYPISRSNNKSKLETQYSEYLGWYTIRSV